MICGPLPKTLNTCVPLLINKNTYLFLGLATLRQNHLIKTPARGPRTTAPWTQRGAYAPG